MSLTKEESISLICSSGALPTVPCILQQLISLDESLVDVRDLVHIIEKDTSVVATILKISNSAMYNRSKTPIVELEKAIINIGVSETIKIATSISIAYSFTHGSKQQEDATRLLWVRSFLMAKTAIHIAKSYDVSEDHLSHNEIYTTALLQSIGRIVLLSCVDLCYFDETMASLSGQKLLQEEERRYGINYIEAGRFILEHWGIPDSITKDITGCNFNNPLEMSYISMICREAFVTVNEYMPHIKSFEQANNEISDLLRKIDESNDV